MIKETRIYLDESEIREALLTFINKDKNNNFNHVCRLKSKSSIPSDTYSPFSEICLEVEQGEE